MKSAYRFSALLSLCLLLSSCVMSGGVETYIVLEGDYILFSEECDDSSEDVYYVVYSSYLRFYADFTSELHLVYADGQEVDFYGEYRIEPATYAYRGSGYMTIADDASLDQSDSVAINLTSKNWVNFVTPDLILPEGYDSPHTLTFWRRN